MACFATQTGTKRAFCLLSKLGKWIQKRREYITRISPKSQNNHRAVHWPLCWLTIYFLWCPLCFNKGKSNALINTLQLFISSNVSLRHQLWEQNVETLYWKTQKDVLTLMQSTCKWNWFQAVVAWKWVGWLCHNMDQHLPNVSTNTNLLGHLCKKRHLCPRVLRAGHQLSSVPLTLRCQLMSNGCKGSQALSPKIMQLFVMQPPHLPTGVSTVRAGNQ